MSQLSAQYPAELIRIAALVRRTLGMQRGSVAHLRMMLKTLHLANQVRAARQPWPAFHCFHLEKCQQALWVMHRGRLRRSCCLRSQPA